MVSGFRLVFYRRYIDIEVLSVALREWVGIISRLDDVA